MDGYKRSYILGVVSGEVMFARDKNGTFKTYSMSSDKTMYAQLVPNVFDMVTFGKSIGNHANANTGDGTIQNYQKTSIDVALWEVELAAGAAEQNLIDAINMINAQNYIITLQYVGKVDSYLTNGVTHEIFNNQNPVHAESLDGNKISRSYLKTMPTTGLGTILKELCQASSGLRQDGGDDNFDYYCIATGWHPDAGKAIYLVNFAQIGFQFNTNNPDPAASQPIIVTSSVVGCMKPHASVSTMFLSLIWTHKPMALIGFMDGYQNRPEDWKTQRWSTPQR